MNNKKSVLIFIELDENKNILPISLECINTGRRLANEWNTKLDAVIMGSDIGRVADELRYYSIYTIYKVDRPILKEYQPDYYVAVFKQVYEKLMPKAIVMGNTLTSIDLAPRIAFSLNVGLVTDCVSIEFDSGEVQFIKPVYSSNIMATFTLASEPYVVTMRSKAEKPAESGNEPNGQIIPVDVEIDENIKRVRAIKRFAVKEKGPQLANADVVVAGGRGIGGPEGFEQLSELARILGGALGASRPPCDLGWVDPNYQVGLTGAIIAPSVYIAVGISGSTQHIAGILGTDTIVAINKDPDANIFNIADYGVVGDYREVLPAFKEQLFSLQTKSKKIR